MLDVNQLLLKMNFEHRTPNAERRMAKPLTDGLGPIGSSKLEVERWTLKGFRMQGRPGMGTGINAI